MRLLPIMVRGLDLLVRYEISGLDDSVRAGSTEKRLLFRRFSQIKGIVFLLFLDGCILHRLRRV